MTVSPQLKARPTCAAVSGAATQARPITQGTRNGMIHHSCLPWAFNTGPHERAREEQRSDTLLFARQTAAIEPICISHLKITSQKKRRVCFRKAHAQPNVTDFLTFQGKQPSNTRTEEQRARKSPEQI
jgi:hypothetical protein